mgnify:FL=1
MDEDEKPPGTEGQRKLYVGLGVVQSYDSRRKIPRNDISIPALEVCLRKATKSATAMSGMGTLLKKVLTQYMNVCVYGHRWICTYICLALFMHVCIVWHMGGLYVSMRDLYFHIYICSVHPHATHQFSSTTRQEGVVCNRAVATQACWFK